jgi:hypothetical protein
VNYCEQSVLQELVTCVRLRRKMELGNAKRLSVSSVGWQGRGWKARQDRLFHKRSGRGAGVNDARDMTVTGPRRCHATQSNVGPGQ